jgi:hypothetical protein
VWLTLTALLELMKTRRLTFRIAFFFLLGLIVCLAAGSIFLSKFALRRVESKLAASGIKIQSLDINLLTRSVTISGLEWQTAGGRDSVTSHRDSTSVHLKAETVRASGIDIIALIRRKELHIGTFVISNGILAVQLPHTRRKKESGRLPESANRNNAGKVATIPLRDISIQHLTLNEIAFAIKRDSVIEHQGVVDLNLREVNLKDVQNFRDPQAYRLGGFDLAIDHYGMQAESSMYTLRLSHVALDSKTKDLVVDSIVLLPKYGKYQFSRKVGKQIDRFVLRIPKVTLSGLDFERMKDSIVVASNVRIDRANLYVFRDKRLPFIKHKNTPLPIALVRSLPFGFAIDSLRIADTKITYEEFPEKGFKTGYIVFNDLNARLNQITNRDFFSGMKGTVLHVTSRVMEHGQIKVDFLLPYDKAQIYNATGKITNLELTQLNPLIETMAYVRIESGTLNTLNFDFDYDDYTSRGKILLNYDNLKLIGLKKEDGTKKNDVKSFALGLFVKKDKDREVPIEKRRGKVYYERDRRRAIFNVWVRSLMSGIKSSVVDSPDERKPQTHKERRESLRQQRREKRDQKKKEKQKEKQTEASDSTRSASVVSSGTN